MSDTTATFTSTVSPMEKRKGSQVLASLVLSVAAAEGGVRALRPRSQPIEPVPVDLRSYFSEQEIERGVRFARPQLALALARAGIGLGALAGVVRRRPASLKALSDAPLAGGALAGAGLATALSLPPLPLAALARRRAIKVGLVTQSWRGWAEDLAKASAIEAGLAAGAGAAVVATTRRWPRSWWLGAGAGSV